MRINTVDNKRNIETRSAITEAILDELENKEFSRIKVSDVIRIAGISRMTFYRYYENLYDALCDYLDIIVNGYMIEGGELNDPTVFMKPEHIEYTYADGKLILHTSIGVNDVHCYKITI